MIWIRADANREIGAGHVMRCLSIAEALKKMGEQVCFLIADEKSVPLLQARGQDYKVLHTDYTCMEEELGILQEEFQTTDSGFFLADSYFVTRKYFNQLKASMPTGYLDDMGLTDLEPDLLINYNIFAHPSLYGANLSGTRLLLGTEYAPLREEFQDIPCQTREKVEQVLVTTGGSDQYNLAGKFLEKAMSNPRTAGLKYCVVSGSYNVHLKDLKELERRYPGVEIQSNVERMSELMQKSDIAVTAGGSTMYELSAVGVPMLCFSFVENQERIVEGFVERQLVCFGGNYLTQGESMLEAAVEQLAVLCEDATLRRTYSMQLKKVVDGQGAMRIAQALVGFQQCL